MEFNSEHLKLSINILRRSKHILTEALNIPRVIPNVEGVPKDWRGLLHYVGGSEGYISCMDPDPTGKVLRLWQTSKELTETYNIGSLIKYLKILDRYDILDDIEELINEDIQFYINNQNEKHNVKIIEEDTKTLTLDVEDYDAFVLYHEDNKESGLNVIRELENRKIKCCATERDVLNLEFVHHDITRIISQRCAKLVILITDSFLKSSLLTYIRTYTQAVGIERRVRNLIPLRFDDSVFPDSLRFYNVIDFTRDVFNNRWDRLYRSIVMDSNKFNNNQISQVINDPVTINTNSVPGIMSAPATVVNDHESNEARNNSEPILDVAGVSLLHSTTIIQDQRNDNIENKIPINTQEIIDSENVDLIKEKINKKVKSKKNKSSLFKKIKNKLTA